MTYIIQAVINKEFKFRNYTELLPHPSSQISPDLSRHLLDMTQNFIRSVGWINAEINPCDSQIAGNPDNGNADQFSLVQIPAFLLKIISKFFLNEPRNFILTRTEFFHDYRYYVTKVIIKDEMWWLEEMSYFKTGFTGMME